MHSAKANHIIQIAPELRYAITDARRCISQSFDFVYYFPLEIYNSALVWLPRAFRIRNGYSTPTSWIATVVDETWDVCENVLQGVTYVKSVAFSPDGQLVVLGLDDRSIFVWNIYTGMLTCSFTGNEKISCVAFSHGRWKVVSVDGKSICVWNIETECKGNTLMPTLSQVSRRATAYHSTRLLVDP